MPGAATRRILGRPSTRFAARRVWLLPALTVVGLGLARLWGGDYAVDTALYTGVAWRMAAEQPWPDWWTPTIGGLPYFNKPPLAFWIHAAWFRVVGGVFEPNALGLITPPLWAVRAPLVAQAALCAALTGMIGRRLAGPKAGLLAGMILALTFPFFAHLDRFVLDYTVLAGVLAGVFAVVAAERPGPASAGRAHDQTHDRAHPPLALVASGLPIGLAALAKPLFPLLTLPLLAVYLGLRGRWRLATWLVPAAVLAVMVALPWHADMLRGHGDAFINQYLGHEILDRGRGGGGIPASPWWSYLWFAARDGGPWALTLLAAIAWLARRPAAFLNRRHRANRAAAFGAVWCVGWLALLSVFGDKRPRYMMHVWPAASLLSALWLTRAAPATLRGPGTHRLGKLAGVVAAGGAALGLTGLLAGDPPSDDWADLGREILARRAAATDGPPPMLWSDTPPPPPREAQVYLTCGVWPRRLWHPSYTEPPAPAAGDLVIIHAREGLGRFGLPPGEAPGVLAARADVAGVFGDYALLIWSAEHAGPAGLPPPSSQAERPRPPGDNPA